MIKRKLKRKQVLNILKKYDIPNVDFDTFIKCIKELKGKIENCIYYSDENFFTYGERDIVNDRIYNFIKDKLYYSYHHYFYNNTPHRIPESYRENILKEFKKDNYNLIIDYLIEFVDSKNLRREDIPDYLNYYEFSTINKKYIKSGIICEQEKEVLLGIINEFEDVLNGYDLQKMIKCDICNKLIKINNKSTERDVCFNCQNLEKLNLGKKKIYNISNFNFMEFFNLQKCIQKSSNDTLIALKSLVINKLCMNYSDDIVLRYKEQLEKLLLRVIETNDISQEDKFKVFESLYIQFDIHCLSRIVLKLQPGQENGIDYTKACEEALISSIIIGLETISTECFSDKLRQKEIMHIHSLMEVGYKYSNIKKNRD